MTGLAVIPMLLVYLNCSYGAVPSEPRLSEPEASYCLPELMQAQDARWSVEGNGSYPSLVPFKSGLYQRLFFRPELRPVNYSIPARMAVSVPTSFTMRCIVQPGMVEQSKVKPGRDLERLRE